MAYAMKIHLKKNAAANGLELKERLQEHRLLIKSRNKTGISTPSDLHSLVASLCFYSNSSYFFSSFFSAVSTFFPISDMTSDDT